ncbi:MAG: PAS domain S-box protein [Lachnospiraceae bacterium]|nr:PAS domain S-box protein [Lachnospiraceae bacterium]
MQDEVKNDFIEKLPIAYACHNVIYDETGNSCDYEFVEVNNAFENMTLLKSAEVVGKRISEILPSVGSINFRWIKTYQEIVLNNINKEFDEQFELSKKWYRVFSYAAGKDYFVTMFLDISEAKRKAEEQLALYTMLNDIIIELDENYYVLNVLSPDESLLFIPPEELIGTKIIDFFPDDLGKKIRGIFVKAKASNRKETITYQSIIPDDEKWFQADIKFIDLKNRQRYIVSVRDITEKKVLEQKMNESESLFRTVFEQIQIGIGIIRDDDSISNVNSEFVRMLGRTKKAVICSEWKDFTHPDDLQEDLEAFEKFKKSNASSYTRVKRYLKKDGTVVWGNIIVSRLKMSNEYNKSPKYICMIKDISENVTANQALQESERSKSVLLSHLPGMAYRCKYDREWTMEFVSEGCYELTGYEPESILFNKKISYNDIISSEYQNFLREKWILTLKKQIFFREEYEIITADGTKKWVLEQGQGIYDEHGKVKALEGLIIDISASKKRELKIEYLKDHDLLTGTYNRRYFFDKMKLMDNEGNLPLSIIIGDINGIRLINHAFGNTQGDQLIKETAKIMKKHCRFADTLARTGGGDFSILMPNTDLETALVIMKKIKAECEEFSQKIAKQPICINISLGCSTKKAIGENIRELYTLAEDHMYKRKLLERKSSHGDIMTAIMATLFAKSQETEKHAKRLAELSKMIGIQMNIPQQTLDLLELFAMLHDVGKIGIDDRILNKPDMLDGEEWQMMKQHPEIGYKIAISSPELEPIAEYILTHHEYWDGSGYPLGIKGEEIPLLSRILAVADSYDAMIENRIYKKAISREEAIEEINKCSEKKFDPRIVQAFNQIVESEEFKAV